METKDILMRRRIIMAIGAAAGLGLALTGCAEGGTPSASPSGSATASGSAAAGGPVASCVVGSWRSTALTADAASRRNNVSAQLTGGAGISVRIAETGATNLDFSSMEPVNFSAKVAGADVRGKFTYAGTASGRISTGPAPAGTSATPAPSGSWAPVGDLNWEATRLTLDLTQPLQARPFDNTPIGRYVGSETGNAVDIDPFFDQGTYTCSGDTLTITPDKDADIPWTLKRT
jgi:hypothetical protein